MRGRPCHSLEAVLLSPPWIFSSSCSSLGGGSHAQAGSIRGRELAALGRHFGRPHRPLVRLHAMGVGPAVTLSTTCPGRAVGVEGWLCRPMSALSRFREAAAAPGGPLPRDPGSLYRPSSSFALWSCGRPVSLKMTFIFHVFLLGYFQ